MTCAAWRDYVLTIGNGPVSSSGCSTLTYSIENVKRDEVCQNEDIVALSDGSELQNVFFSDSGVRQLRETIWRSMLISCRIRAYTIQTVFFWFSSTGERPARLVGCHC